LQVLFLRANNLTDEDIKQMAHVMKPDPANPNFANKTLKVLDISYNPLTEVSVKYLADMMETNRSLEYLGLAKLKLEYEQVVPLFN
jgi:Ran GTPase-activating protein (RanGAP) involved in mRNA processing and transport